MSAGVPATKADLEGQIKDIARDLQASVGRTTWLAIAALGVVGVLLQFF